MKRDERYDIKDEIEISTDGNKGICRMMYIAIQKSSNGEGSISTENAPLPLSSLRRSIVDIQQTMANQSHSE